MSLSSLFSTDTNINNNSSNMKKEVGIEMVLVIIFIYQVAEINRCASTQ
jgi:hypothetical protein